MADNQRGPYLAGGFPGQALKRDQSNRTMWVDSRDTLTANRFYSVNPIGGSDEGVTGPFKTIQRAIDVAASCDLNGKHIYIELYPGTYVEQLFTRPITGGPGYETGQGNSINILGISANPALCVINGPGGVPYIEGILQAKHAGWGFIGLTLGLTTLGMCVVTFDGSDITFDNTVFRAAFADNMPFFMTGGRITGYGTWIFYSDWGSLMYVQNGSVLVGPPTTYLQENPVMNANTINVFTKGTVNFGSSVINGTATGKRYDATGMSLIISNGANPNFFPGDVAGTLASGSVYL